MEVRVGSPSAILVSDHSDTPPRLTDLGVLPDDGCVLSVTLLGIAEGYVRVVASLAAVADQFQTVQSSSPHHTR